MTRWLLGCGVIAGPLFVAVFLGEGATRAGYNAKRHPVSLLALGPSGWVQTASFFVTGALVVCLAAGVWRALRASGRAPWGAFLVGLVGVGLLGAGLFPTDAALGYPPGTRRPAAVTTTGKLHLFCALLVFLGLPGACCVLARLFARWRRGGWARYSVASGVGTFGAFCCAAVALFGSARLVAFAGVFQRASLLIGLGWLTAVAVWFWRGGGPARSREAG